ncbi:right-handed parallel beta-helix repeat-containing protein [Pseudarthrobacter sp. L19]|uniref:right-handed parallel beta-helix repeat-containing protein n=1 Tax=Pseudarthrobacter sp. L19 TaxID=3423951 RepID=UPI003D7A65D2
MADQSGDALDGNVPGRLNEYLVDIRHSTNAVVEDITTRNPFTYSIAVVASKDFCVLNNRTAVRSSGRYNQLDGIHITDSHSGLVVGNRVDQGQGNDGDDGLVAQTIGEPVYDVEFRDNDVRGGSHGSGMQMALGTHEIHDLKVSGNRFWGSPNGIQTGHYDGAAALRQVSITKNNFVDVAGPSVVFNGELIGITVADNSECRSGGVQVAEGRSNRVDQPTQRC